MQRVGVLTESVTDPVTESPSGRIHIHSYIHKNRTESLTDSVSESMTQQRNSSAFRRTASEQEETKDD
jgi:hypothetical protein